MSRMPSFYVPPLGGPLNWQDEQSGVLPTAVLLFFTCMTEKRQLAPTQFNLVRDYCDYYIHAPCWDNNPYHDDDTRKELARLRYRITNVTTQEALDEWIHACMGVGIDPL